MVLPGLLSAIRGAEPALIQLPSWWNKDWFHFVNIIDRREDRCFPGYLWATDNWVEVHCFAKIQVKTVLKILDKDFHISTWTDIGEACVPLPSQGMYLQANKGFVFSDRVKSFICPRDAVFYATRGDWAKFYSRIFKFRDTVYCNPSDEDLARWTQWHPNDDYKKVFSGATVIGYYFGESHGGELTLRELRDGRIYPSEWCDEPDLTYD